MSNKLLIDGVALDLSPDTAILPSFQVSDLLQPDKIQSDFTPELSVPGSAHNHALLGQAAYDGSAARVPYKSLPNATFLSEGVEIMPRARLFVKGFDAGRYQLQLFAGNRRFVEALGDKTLRDLDFSRFTHRWTLDNIAQKASVAHWQANGWGYELYDRGKPLDFSQVSPYELYPTLSASLIWQQILAEAGFTASDWESPLLDKLQLPAVQVATLSQAFRDARRLRVGLGPGHAESGNPSANRDSITRTIPFDDNTRTLGTVPPISPTVPGVYDRVAYSFTPDQTMYVRAEARTTVFLQVPLAKASAQVFLHVNGLEVGASEKKVVSKDTRFSIGCVLDPLLLNPGDVLTAVVKLKGEDPNLVLGTKWGFEIFQDTVYSIDGQSIPVDKFEVTVLETLPPGGEVDLADWLPDIKCLDFFKTLVQLGGLTTQCDAYEDQLRLTPSATILFNVGKARDWTGKRDAPDLPQGQARSVAYRFGSFGQRNWLKWKEDSTATLGYQGKPKIPNSPGYGDGALLIEDVSLPVNNDMVTLPFAASEPSRAIPGMLWIPAYKLRENEDAFADPAYDKVTAAPRLTLASGRTVALTLVEGQQKRTVAVPVSYFASEEEPVSLDAEAYILPVCWAGLRAMLTECRYHKERYRLSPRDIAELLTDSSIPVWDGVLKGYFSISKVSEYSASRSVEVELLRLHPSLLGPPISATQPAIGREFFEGEFNVTATTPPEFY